jgi:nicotinamidase-related amidase
MNTALIVIDVQKGIDEAAHWGGSRNNPEAEGNIMLLLAHWREKNFPVIIVQHCSVEKSSPFFPGKEGNALKDFVRPLNGELIQKNCANALLEKKMVEKLSAQKVTRLVITGFVTNNSVEATARMAGETGYDTVVVSDACAAFNKTGIDGTVYPSELVHQLSLTNLSGEYARIQTTKEVLMWLNDFKN